MRSHLPLRLVLALALLAGCGYEGGTASDDGVSTAGSFDDETSTAGPFDTGAPSAAGTLGEAGPVRSGDAGAALRAALDADFSPDRTLGYDAARDALYAYEARTTGGQLCEVYGGACTALPPGDPSQAAGAIGVNAEHTWPQSYGARDEPLRSDLHHLFASLERVNASRGNLPLADVPDASAQAWYRDRESASRLPPGQATGAWSQRGAGRFEPRDAHKGNAARAVFYVVAIYPEVLARPGGAAFFETMRADLLRWHRLDPPDAAERARSTWIARLQGTENPFVTDPSLAERAFGGRVPSPVAAPDAPRPDGPLTTGPVTAGPMRADVPDAAPPGPSPSGRLWLSALHYDNPGDDVNEGVEVAGAPRAGLDGWTLALVNGADGQTYRTVPLGGALGADGRRWIGVAGLQNGAPDAVALVAPDGRVAEFWSYEGSVSATNGPAAGQTARPMPVAQDRETQSGTALVRPSPTAAWRVGPHPLARGHAAGAAPRRGDARLAGLAG